MIRHLLQEVFGLSAASFEINTVHPTMYSTETFWALVIRMMDTLLTWWHGVTWWTLIESLSTSSEKHTWPAASIKVWRMKHARLVLAELERSFLLDWEIKLSLCAGIYSTTALHHQHPLLDKLWLSRRCSSDHFWRRQHCVQRCDGNVDGEGKLKRRWVWIRNDCPLTGEMYIVHVTLKTDDGENWLIILIQCQQILCWVLQWGFF